ncbi:hypothetical protein MIDIC_410029 [Alphaproteobacteria bacterium]
MFLYTKYLCLIGKLLKLFLTRHQSVVISVTSDVDGASILDILLPQRD